MLTKIIYLHRPENKRKGEENMKVREQNVEFIYFGCGRMNPNQLELTLLNQ